MYKKYLIITAGILLIIALALMFLLKPSTEKVNTSTDTKNNMVPTSTKESAVIPTVYSSNYVLFNNNLDSFKNNKRLLFFYANWCPTCSTAEKDINNNLSGIPEDVKIIRINYNDTETDDNEKELAKKYGVSYQHTFVLIDANGNEVKKWNGGGFSNILNNLK